MTPLYRPRKKRCVRVCLNDWRLQFDRVEVGVSFFVHRAEVPNQAIYTLSGRIGKLLDKSFGVCNDRDECFIEYFRKA